MKNEPNNQEVAQILQDFLEAKGVSGAWDNYTLGTTFSDKYLEEIRLRCAGLSQEFPPEKPNEYCNEEGRNVIRAYIRQLRDMS